MGMERHIILRRDSERSVPAQPGTGTASARKEGIRRGFRADDGDAGQRDVRESRGPEA